MTDGSCRPAADRLLPQEAVPKLLEEHLLRRLQYQDADQFRRTYLYHVEIDDLLREHESYLQGLFQHYTGVDHAHAAGVPLYMDFAVFMTFAYVRAAAVAMLPRLTRAVRADPCASCAATHSRG